MEEREFVRKELMKLINLTKQLEAELETKEDTLLKCIHRY